MRLKNAKVGLISGLLSIVGFSSCLNELPSTLPQGNVNTTSVFNYDSQGDYRVNVSFNGINNLPVTNTGVEIYDRNPLLAGTSTWRTDVQKFATAQTDADGQLITTLTLSSIVDTLYLKINSIDFPLPVKVAVKSKNIAQTVSISKSSVLRSASAVATPWKYEVAPFTASSNLWVLGDFSNLGYPSYVESRDVVSNDLKLAVNAALPEKVNLVKTNPSMFTDPNSGSFVTLDKCQIWVSFLAEGAWWQNTLGYIYYPTNSAPASISDISKQVVIFPNSSTPYGSQSGDSGNGSMVQGDKVRLKYYNETTRIWTDTFPSGLTISWFMYPAGFHNGVGVNKGITPTWNPLYSLSDLNTNKLQQNILLYDKVTDHIIIGFEDTERNAKGSAGDQDFNDALYYATANPITAIDKRNMKVLVPVTPTDTDGDGVKDDIDEFPNDPQRAFTQYYPTTGNGTLAFEDNWPNKGDYDFNDLVVSYRYQLVTNAAGNIKDVHASYSVEAVGAKYRNGFAIQFKTPPANIESVSGQRDLAGNGIFNVNAKGYETGQSFAVIPVFPDAHKLFGNGPTDFINTVQDLPTLPAVPIELSVTFATAVSAADLGSAPFNPFLVADQQRGREIHLAGQRPTDLANLSLFGTADDRTNQSTIWYKGDLEYPWALNIPDTFYYPIELTRIDEVYLKLPEWVQSLGALYTDWYSNPAYRNNAKVYQKR
ncbi:MAG: LruC domain-containing protein [Bacteroidales bacterium]